MLLSIADYRRLTEKSSEEFLARMRMDDDVDVDFEPARLEMQVPDL